MFTPGHCSILSYPFVVSWTIAMLQAEASSAKATPRPITITLRNTAKNCCIPPPPASAKAPCSEATKACPISVSTTQRAAPAASNKNESTSVLKGCSGSFGLARSSASTSASALAITPRAISTMAFPVGLGLDASSGAGFALAGESTESGANSSRGRYSLGGRSTGSLSPNSSWSSRSRCCVGSGGFLGTLTITIEWQSGHFTFLPT